MKNKRLLYSLWAVALLSIAGYFVYAATILVTVEVTSCTETDGGLNYVTLGQMWGDMIVNSSTNQTQFFNVTDYCITNFSVGEYACGSSIDPAFAGIAGLVEEDCNLVPLNGTTNATMCFQGRCI
jgi:hypothetical protein